jgi:hypothetical protein
MPYLSEVERGRKEVSSEVLAAICESLRIGLPDVLAEVGRMLVGARARPDRAARLDGIGDRALRLDGIGDRTARLDDIGDGTTRLHALPGDPAPQESADDTAAGPAVPDAMSDRVAPLGRGGSSLGWPQQPGSDSARCLLAA